LAASHQVAAVSRQSIQIVGAGSSLRRTRLWVGLVHWVNEGLLSRVRVLLVTAEIAMATAVTNSSGLVLCRVFMRVRDNIFVAAINNPQDSIPSFVNLHGYRLDFTGGERADEAKRAALGKSTRGRTCTT
jgi:hypothetical protein